MTLSYSKHFMKSAKKLPPRVREQLMERIERFGKNPFDPLLHNHMLKGAYKEYGSINITGDYRALYLTRGEEVVFDHVGTHAQLYE